MGAISSYTAATAITDDDVILGNDGSTTKTFPASLFKSYVNTAVVSAGAGSQLVYTTWRGSDGGSVASTVTASGGTVNIQGNKMQLAAGAGGFYSDTARALLTSYSAADFEVVTSLSPVTTVEGYASFQFRGDGAYSTGWSRQTMDNCYFVELVTGSNLLTVKRKRGGTDVLTIKSVARTWAANDIVHLRIRAAWNVIDIKYWFNTDTEPVDFQWRVLDAEHLTRTRFGWTMLGGASASAHTMKVGTTSIFTLTKTTRHEGPFPFRGFGLPTNTEDYQVLDAQWWYDWGGTGDDNHPTLASTYVPMAFEDWTSYGDPINYPTTYPYDISAAAGRDTLLGFNEPDNAGQHWNGVMSTTTALNLWQNYIDIPKMTSVRLGSPAPTSSVDGIQWLTDWYAGIASRGLRCDFTAIHWYGDATDDGTILVNFIYDNLAKFGRPVWLTEFSGWTYSRAINTAYATAIYPRLAAIPGLERVSWFTNRDGTSGYEYTGLVDGAGALNVTGIALVDAAPPVVWHSNEP